MNGIICVNKPTEYTSFDVVARIKGMSKTKRVGHAGTLDPMATGVLPVFIGNATKACNILPNDDKGYIAKFKLGITTDTLDIWGNILSTTESHITLKDIEDLLPKFRGEIMQLPPMYSAVRINGKRLYDIARNGGEVTRTPRKTNIFKLSLIEFNETEQTGTIEVHCAKGTYVRAICDDIGKDLGVGCVMTALVRTFVGAFTIDDCYTMDQLQKLTTDQMLEQNLMAVDKVFADFPQIHLNEIQSLKFKNGVKLDLNRVHHNPIKALHCVYSNTNMFLGLASLELDTMTLIIEKMF